MSDGQLVATRQEAGPCPSTARASLPAGLAGSPLTDRYCFWRGHSGQRYIFSVYRADETDELPRYANAVVIVADRRPDGTRRLRRVLQTGELPELLINLPDLQGRDARDREIHFHLLADDATTRRGVVADLSMQA